MFSSASISLHGRRVLAARHTLRRCKWRRHTRNPERLERKENRAEQKCTQPAANHGHQDMDLTKASKEWLGIGIRYWCQKNFVQRRVANSIFRPVNRLSLGSVINDRLKSFSTYLASRAFSRFGRGFLIVAVSLSIGVHWAALQSVAWVSMLVEYSQHASVATAIAQTFDGQHPCTLCKQILASQTAPKKDGPLLTKARPDLICATRTIVLLTPFRDLDFFQVQLKKVARFDPPPTPPPRFELS
jgi:hypothetical protein